MKQIDAKREAGKQAFTKKQWTEAVDIYTQGIEIDSDNEQLGILFRSNRALALNAVRLINLLPIQYTDS